MILCPYCGNQTNSCSRVLEHGDSVSCENCGNPIRVLLLEPNSWDRINAKLSIYNFLVRELETAKGMKLTICPVCTTPFFGDKVCRNCRKCLSCKSELDESTDGMVCAKCSRTWGWEEFIDKKRVVEGGKW